MNDPAARALAPPALGLRIGEGRFLLDLPRLAWSWRALSREPRGGGEPVLTLPGLGFGDRALAPLRAYLRSLGYQVRGWGLGRNRGNVNRLLPEVVAIVAEMAAAARRPVRMVAWSLGGVLARETAREHPEIVDRVVTLGTPVVGGPKYTIAAPMYERRGYDLDAIAADAAERNAQGLEVPVTAIRALQDGVVASDACVDPHPEVENLAVRTTHTGLLLHPEVYRIVARRLAAGAAQRGEAVA